jgi:hypothetical protein
VRIALVMFVFTAAEIIRHGVRCARYKIGKILLRWSSTRDADG